MCAGMWRQRPEAFEIDGHMPVHDVFAAARVAWAEIVSHESDVTLVVSHKSVLRALVCVALGLGPESFRAIDIYNSGVTIFWVNTDSEAMLQSLNLTTHLAMTLRY
jgi:serine/threonine-protein phosphatase PGAM5